MPYAFFRIPSHGPDGLVDELNQFLATHKIVRVHREWQAADSSPCWAFCVEYLAKVSVDNAGMAEATSKIDYRDVLSPEEFAIFSKLREVRKTLAEQEKQPVFAIFSNAQLAAMVQRKCRTAADLGKIAGIGESKISRFGAALIAVLTETTSKPSEA